MSYDFAQNKLKLANAIAAIKARGEVVSDELVYKEYVKRGGKVIDVKIEPKKEVVAAKKLEDTVQVVKQPELTVLDKKARSRKSVI